MFWLFSSLTETQYKHVMRTTGTLIFWGDEGKDSEGSVLPSAGLKIQAAVIAVEVPPLGSVSQQQEEETVSNYYC